MKISFDNKLLMATIGLVSVIFLAETALMFWSASKEIKDDDHAAQVEGLLNFAVYVRYFMDNGMTFEEMKEVVESPWRDSKDGGIYYLVEADSAKIIKKRLKKAYPGAAVIRRPISDEPGAPVLMKFHSSEERVAPLRRTRTYVLSYTVIFLLLLIVTIYGTIRYYTRSEVELKRRIESELLAAQRIQRQMLPSESADPTFGGNVDVGAMIRPAKEIGGDYYNVFRLGRHLHFIIADVSGKGIPAALFMARLADIYTMCDRSGKTPAEVVGEINARLCHKNTTCMFATAIIGRLELESGVLEICRAGHEQPLLVSAEGKPSFMELAGNPPLGLMPCHDYTMLTTRLEPHSHLLLYTDGVSEAEDAAQALFGHERLMEAVAAAGKDTPSQQLIDDIMSHIRAFTDMHEQSDDITMLDIRLLPHDGQQKIRLRCELSELERLLAFADDLELDNKVMLALEEAVVNVFNYSGATFVEVEAERQADATVLTVTDDGTPFDPIAWHNSVAEPLIDREGFLKRGGEGINLVMNLMSEVAYARVDGRNRLTIKYQPEQ
ncbi:MAG: SpoIIE family protein phosphatase [Bacteroidaceae bacterium]|nr:SpoIIE family protein phosphatase [Bacteroidaceae bacterium]